MIRALILFGSHARGDNAAQSDLDIIAVVDEHVRVPYEKEELSISFYRKEFLLKLASSGNLFALHLAFEAKSIFDPDDIFSQIRSNFRKKENYNKEVADASMLGWFLLRHADKVVNWPLYNKRVAWCVRTILVAKAYEQNLVVFSSQALYQHFHNKDAKELVGNKNSTVSEEQSLFRLARFLRDFGLGDPGVYEVDNINAHIGYIFRSGNLVGRNTISSLFSGAHGDYLMN